MIYQKHQIIKRIRDLGLQESPFMIVGIRSKANKANEFDDKIYLITPKVFTSFTATTNAGTYWLLNFLNPNGTAVLKSDKQYYYKIGSHKGYKALVQAAPVTVFRDVDKDVLAEEYGTQETGYFAINIHRANPSVMSKLVDKWSAGCQVIANPKDFDFLIQECEKSGLEVFPYILLKEF